MPKFEREVEIDATVEKVWEALINPDLWPQWFPGMESVANVTAISAGGKFEWTGKGQKGIGIIVKMEPTTYLQITTQVGDDKDAHYFSLQNSGGFLGMAANECKIKYTLDTLMGGGFLGNFIAGGNPVDVLKVTKAMTSFRKVVEGL